MDGPYSSRIPKGVGRLPNRLVEMAVIVGVDKSTGLHSKVPPEDEYYSGELYTTTFESQLIGAVSSHTALFPFSDPAQQEEYPPSSKMTTINYPVLNKKRTGRYSLDTLRENDSLQTSFDSSCEDSDRKLHNGAATANMNLGRRIAQRVSRKMSIVSTAINYHRKQQDNLNMNTHGIPDLPVPYDVLTSLKTFCYPEDIFVEETPPEPRVHYLVLTDIAGNRSFATCITFYRPFVINRKVGEKGSWDCELWSEKKEPDLEPGQYLAYLPLCIAFISKKPYYSVLKDCLSRLVQLVLRNPSDVFNYIKVFTLQLTMTPVPPPGHVALQFTLSGIRFRLNPPDSPYSSLIDIPLKQVFQHFYPEDVLRLLTCVLTQQRIVFLSSSYGLLTLITQSLLLMVEPFQWNFPYVPILPRQLLELLDAPGTFMMGCHSDYTNDVQQVEGLVVANIDNGELYICPTIALPKVPQEPAYLFLSTCRRFSQQFDTMQLEWLTPFSYEEMKAMQQKQRDETNTYIMQMCQQLMVSLFRDVLSYIKVEQRFFNRDQFLEGIEDYQDFYKQILETQLFNGFLKDRFAMKTDSWSVLEEKTRPALRCSLGENDDWARRTAIDVIQIMLGNRPGPSVLRKRSSSLNMQPSLPPSSVQSSPFSPRAVVKLPTFALELYSKYYWRCSKQVADLLSEHRTVEVRASCMYLQGMYKIANNQMSEAMEDFHQVSSLDRRIFPKDVIQQVLSNMNPSEKEQLMAREFFRRSDDWRHLAENRRCSILDSPILMKVTKLPETDLNLNQFADLVQILEIAADHDTIRRLFDALTLGKSPTIDPFTFEIFYECWKEVEMECIGFNAPGLELDLNECFIKVSEIIKTNLGTGRIALTQKRLFFLFEGANKIQEVIKLRNIGSLEKIQHSSFLTQVAALKVSNKAGKKPSFIASLKEERDAWYVLINEMWAGKLISEELRDAALVQQAAQNVLLVDALLRSSEEPGVCHQADKAKATSTLCYFTQRHEQGMDQLPPETKDVLQHRVDPNIRETERRTIDAMLYTPGRRSSAFDDDAGPKLWCGMGNGKVQVFDASTWLLEMHYLHAKDRISSLLAVGENHVWAASLDTNIYVIDITTQSCNQTLVAHRAMVTDLVFNPDLNMVLSASIDGEIIGWSIKTMQPVTRIILEDSKTLCSLQYLDKLIWCCTRNSVLVVNMEGDVQHSVTYEHEGFASTLDCFLLTPNNEVWAGCGREGIIAIWDQNTMRPRKSIEIFCRGISKMVRVQDKVWVGTKDGLIYIVNVVTHEVEKELDAHFDMIRAMCCAQTRYVMSGAGSKDGKVAIWRTSAV